MLEWMGFIALHYIVFNLIVGGCSWFWLAFTFGDLRRWTSFILLIVPAIGVTLIWLAWVDGPITVSFGLK